MYVNAAVALNLLDAPDIPQERLREGRAEDLDFSGMKVGVRAGDGKCVICDSYVRPATLVRVCDECNYGSYAGRCVICGGVGISDAYYCKECTQQEKDVSFRLALLVLSIWSRMIISLLPISH